MSAAARHFARHYAEMIAAMFLGMMVLGPPLALAIVPFGIDLHDGDAPALLLLGMAATMTAPMVAWMRYRGHGWAPCADMAAAMFVPTFVLVALLAGGLVEDVGTLLVVEHVVMLPAMLVAMLLRHDEYTGAEHHGVVAN